MPVSDHCVVGPGLVGEGLTWQDLVDRTGLQLDHLDGIVRQHCRDTRQEQAQQQYGMELQLHGITRIATSRMSAGTTSHITPL